MTDLNRADLIRQYAKAGIHVNPVYVSESKDGRKDVRPVGKWRDTSSASSADVEAWFGAGGEHEGASVLIDCGKSGLVVIDPDGPEGIANWEALGVPPTPARVKTPGGGRHDYYREHPARVIGNDQDGKIAEHVDVRGLGGFVIAPPSTDWRGTYEWIDGPPDWSAIPIVPDLVIERMKAKSVTLPVVAGAEDAFDSAGGEERRFTEKEAEAFVLAAYQKLKATRQGFNGAINNFAMACAHFPQWYPRERCARLMMKGLGTPQGWAGPDAEDWKTIESAYGATEAGKSWTAVERTAAPSGDVRERPTVSDGGKPDLEVGSSADMTNWIEHALGVGTLSGYFLRGGAVTHTPRVDEAGYVAPRDGKDDDNGPAQMAAVSPGQMAAKIQFAHRCYKIVDVKDEAGKKTGEKKEVAALFPLEAARRAVDAPEALTGLRTLRGLTHTPMVRADGSVLATPGYDPSTGYLFLPGAGVDVAPVPETPSPEELTEAVRRIEEILIGFPWDSADDKANYYGLLLTPLLRLVCPPSYKLFGIGAHQPGSGKTLLADVARILHGGVLRSEMPEDEAEMKKVAASILGTTAAPVIHIDNITGVLRSGVLAGLLTAEGEIQERELGKSSNMTYRNDRVWVATGNNLSLGGDLVRRTIIISIDPNMANPETRSFAIADLKGWVADHRNELLWALLVLVRHWVASGCPLASRHQSDSFASWEASVAGILAACGVPGAFDAESGKRAAAGGDDDGLAGVLERLWDRHEGRAWTVAEVLSETYSVGDIADSVVESRDWLPSSVLDKLSRSEAAGRKTMGWWLKNRIGRWVSGSDQRSYVIREAGTERHVSMWKVERTP
jgi:hypothetical protein